MGEDKKITCAYCGSVIPSMKALPFYPFLECLDCAIKRHIGYWKRDNLWWKFWRYVTTTKKKEMYLVIININNDDNHIEARYDVSKLPDKYIIELYRMASLTLNGYEKYALLTIHSSDDYVNFLCFTN
jgi:hypothetical protein